MDTAIAHALVALNTAFYREHAASFSATRQAPWQGWRQVAEHLRPLAAAGEALSVLDLACGNLRFERFLSDELPGCALSFHAIDNCTELIDAPLAAHAVHLHAMDILEDLLEHRDPMAGLPSCDASVCFGFMHHVPGFELRRAVLDALVSRTEAGGIVAVSFWQFMHDERLSRKARATTAAYALKLPGGTAPKPDTAHAAGLPDASGAISSGDPDLEPSYPGLEPGDYFLPWQDDRRALRYCHHFEDAEIDQLVASLPAGIVREAVRFSADGRSGNLNRYLVLERTGRGRTAPN